MVVRSELMPTLSTPPAVGLASAAGLAASAGLAGAAPWAAGAAAAGLLSAGLAASAGFAGSAGLADGAAAGWQAMLRTTRRKSGTLKTRRMRPTLHLRACPACPDEGREEKDD